jgi:hypothetical protein
MENGIIFIPLGNLSLMLPRIPLVGKNTELILRRRKVCGMTPTVWKSRPKLRMNLGGWASGKLGTNIGRLL